MKAISVRHPWADLIASGQKTIETRTWPTRYRGDVLICASARPSGAWAGHALCIVRIIDCRPMTQSDESAARCLIYPRAWSWILADVRRIDPFPVKGKLSFFEIPDSAIVPLPRDPRPGQHTGIQP